MSVSMVRHAVLALSLSAAVSGCATRIQTMTARPSDTYYRWNDRMDSMPFVFHLPEGRIEAFDGKGMRWPDPIGNVEALRGRRVEIFLGQFTGPGTSMCGGSPKLAAREKGNSEKVGGNVVAALCDRDRTVVSYIDRAKPHVLGEHEGYVSIARYLLLEGLWGATTEDSNPCS